MVTGDVEAHTCVGARPGASEPGMRSLLFVFWGPGHPDGEHHRGGRLGSTREAWLRFPKAMQIPQNGNLWTLQCGFDLSVIWPKARRVHHRVPSTHAAHQSLQVVGICLWVSCLLRPCVPSTRSPLA